MDAESTDVREMHDYALNMALEAHEAEELDGLSIQNQRLARIQEYEEAAVLRSDPFAAVIGMGNAYFQRIFEHFGEAVLEALDSRAHTVEELRELAPEVRLMVKLRDAIETDIAVQQDVGGRKGLKLSKLAPGSKHHGGHAMVERAAKPLC